MRTLLNHQYLFLPFSFERFPPSVCLSLFSPISAHPGSRFWKDVKSACAGPPPPPPRPRPRSPRSHWIEEGIRSCPPKLVRLQTRVCPQAPKRIAVDCSDLHFPRVPRKPSCTPVRTLLKFLSGGHFVAASALSFHFCGLNLSPVLFWGSCRTDT